MLASQNLTLTSILANDRKVYLHDKVILGCGADIHDTTDTMHLDNISLFEKVGALCAEPVIGIDFIASDISRSYLEQKCAILEANSLPYIDMHHYPVTVRERCCWSRPRPLDFFSTFSAFYRTRRHRRPSSHINKNENRKNGNPVHSPQGKTRNKVGVWYSLYL